MFPMNFEVDYFLIGRIQSRRVVDKNISELFFMKLLLFEKLDLLQYLLSDWFPGIIFGKNFKKIQIHIIRKEIQC